MQLSSAIQHRLHALLAGNPDEAVLRWIFRSVVMVTAVVLAADLAGMQRLDRHVRSGSRDPA